MSFIIRKNITSSRFKYFIVFSLVFLIFSFPLQVIFGSPLLSLLSSLVMTTLLVKKYKLVIYKLSNVSGGVKLYICLFIILVIFHGIWQYLFGYLNVEGLLTSYVTFLLPFLYFYYYALEVDDNDVLVTLRCLAYIGLIVGFLFLYENILNIFYHQVTWYSVSASNYTLSRDVFATTLPTRDVANGARGYGPLETHYVSSAVTALGGFAALAISGNNFFRSSVIFLLYTVLIICTMSTTSTVLFFVSIALINPTILTILQSFFFGNSQPLLTRYNFRNIFFLLIGLVILILVFVIFLSSSEEFYSYTLFQVLLVLDPQAIGLEHSYFDGFLYRLDEYYTLLLQNFPAGFIIGDGYSDSFNVIPKGGDYGFAETLSRLGPLMFAIFFVGIGFTIIRAIKRIKFNSYNINIRTNAILFAMRSIVFIVFMDLHYSIWGKKAIFPILLIAIAWLSNRTTFRDSK
jgi:hypothetical protein